MDFFLKFCLIAGIMLFAFRFWYISIKLKTMLFEWRWYKAVDALSMPFLDKIYLVDILFNELKNNKIEIKYNNIPMVFEEITEIFIWKEFKNISFRSKKDKPSRKKRFGFNLENKGYFPA